MAEEDCLFSIVGFHNYLDCLWIAAISSGFTLGQLLILGPLMKPNFLSTIVKFLCMQFIDYIMLVMGPKSGNGKRKDWGVYGQ